MIMNIFVICNPCSLCAPSPPFHLCVPVILVLLGFGLDLNLFISFWCSTLCWAEILKCCSNKCCLCCPWVYLFIGSIVSSLRGLLRGKHPQFPACIKNAGLWDCSGCWMEVKEKRAPETKQKCQNTAGNTAGHSWIGWK